jgi:hypothetical protein
MDVRAYLPGLTRHHVVAIRLAGATTSGDGRVGRLFLLGGGNANPAAGSLSSDAISLLRGFATNTFAGPRVGLLNVDYRWPVARPQRGLGTWPILLHTVHAAVFADTGHAWAGRFRGDDVKTSAGAELSANLVLGYSLPLTTTLGMAWAHDGRGVVADRTAVYGRIGYAF